jgi:cytochrome c553
LRDAPPTDALDKYTAMVATCMNCHEQSCPGPMVRIKKLL